MLVAVIGHSLEPDSALAVAELLGQARAELDGRTPGAALLLSSVEHDHAGMLEAIDAVYPGIPLIGCTTDGELSSRLGYAEGTSSLTLLHSDALRFAAGVGRALSSGPVAAARAAVAQARAALPEAPRICLITPESLTVSASQALDALNDELARAFGQPVPVFGGLASDQWRFEGTRQFFGREVLRDALPILLISGPLHVSHGVASGWQPIGQANVVTRSVGNVVARIGAMTALDFYRRYLGATMLPSGETPLAVFEDGSTRFYLRAPLAFDEAEGSVTFAGDVPEGAGVQITTATRDEIVAASQAAIDEARRGYAGGEPELAMVFSCAARQQLLGTRTREEYSIVASSLGRELPTLGFYAYGEFAPLVPAGASRFHNETFIAVLLGTESSADHDA